MEDPGSCGSERAYAGYIQGRRTGPLRGQNPLRVLCAQLGEGRIQGKGSPLRAAPARSESEDDREGGITRKYADLFLRPVRLRPDCVAGREPAARPPALPQSSLHIGHALSNLFLRRPQAEVFVFDEYRSR